MKQFLFFSKSFFLKENQLFLFKFKELNKFILLAFINFLITNIALQIMLLFCDVWLATAMGQIFNSFFGFLIYSRYVFNNKNIQIIRINKFIILSIISYYLNYCSIKFLSLNYNYSKNLAAIINIPFIAIFSYLGQKFFVFKK